MSIFENEQMDYLPSHVAWHWLPILHFWGGFARGYQKSEILLR